MRIIIAASTTTTATLIFIMIMNNMKMTIIARETGMNQHHSVATAITINQKHCKNLKDQRIFHSLIL
jgi:hypothetical protein